MRLNDTVYVKLLVSILVALEDGSPVIETLQQFKTEVASVLREFEACFRGQCGH